MSTPEEIYRTFVSEEADASRQRNRTKTPLDISKAWMSVLMAGDASRFNEVADVSGYTENCLGLTGWTTGFETALQNLQKNVLAPFKNATSSVEEVVQGENTVVIRLSNEGAHAGEFLGIPATGRLVRWDLIAIIHTRNGKVVGMWSQPDLYGIYQQIKPGQTR
jgi:predicted ester cyclase